MSIVLHLICWSLLSFGYCYLCVKGIPLTELLCLIPTDFAVNVSAQPTCCEYSPTTITFF